MSDTAEAALTRLMLEQELARDEGKRLEAYRDSVGLWTIGVGHLLGDAQRMTHITEPECRALLDHDITVAERAAQELVPSYIEIDDVRQRALVNMAFNLGMRRLSKFEKFLAAVQVQDWDKAAEEMINSKWATQVGPRAQRLAHMIRSGSAQEAA